MSLEEKLNLKDFKRDLKKVNTTIKTVNLTEKNFLKVKSKKIHLSRAVNYFIENNSMNDLNLEFNDIQEENKNRVVSSVSIKNDNLKKVLKLNLTRLVNHVIELF